MVSFLSILHSITIRCPKTREPRTQRKAKPSLFFAGCFGVVKKGLTISAQELKSLLDDIALAVERWHDKEFAS